MALMDFSIDTSGSPQDVQRKQALADALMKQGMDSSAAAGGKGGGWITALNRGLAGALGGYQQGQARQEEQQGRDSVRQQLAAALQGNGGKIDPQTMIGLASNPWATPGQTSVVTHVADMQAQQARQAVEDQHWKASFGLQQQAAARAAQAAERANMTDEEKAVEREKVLRHYGIDPNSPEGRTFSISGSFTDPNLPKVLSPGASVVRPGTGEVIVKNGGDALLDEDTIKALAQQARAGDTSVFQNLGRGSQGAENIVKLRKEIARQNGDEGVSGAEQALRNAEMAGVKAGQRTIGTKGANIEMAATEFNQVLPVVQAASQAVKRTDYPDLNKIILAGESKTGDPNVVKFGGGVNTLVNLYARAISPTGNPTVSDKEHAREILSASWSSGQFDAAVGMMQQEIKAALSSPEKVRDEMRSRFLKGQGAAPVGFPAPGGQAEVPSGPVKVTSPAEARKLPSGTKIILPDGSPGVVP